MQHGSQPIIVVNDVFHGIVGKFVGLTMDVAFFHPPACHPHTETISVVIPSNFVTFVETFAKLDDRKPPHFPSPVNQRRIQ